MRDNKGYIEMMGQLRNSKAKELCLVLLYFV